MNAMALKWLWRAALQPARLARLRRRQWGFVRPGAERLPGVESRAGEAHERFEVQARLAAREWLML